MRTSDLPSSYRTGCRLDVYILMLFLCEKRGEDGFNLDSTAAITTALCKKVGPHNFSLWSGMQLNLALIDVLLLSACHVICLLGRCQMQTPLCLSESPPNRPMSRAWGMRMS